jgi:hypothetical protein
MDYDAETGEITLTGAARLWRGESVVVSERIVYDSRAQVVSAGSQAQGERVNAIILPAAAPEAPEATETDESPSGAAGEAAAASPDAASPAPEAATGQ